MRNISRRAFSAVSAAALTRSVTAMQSDSRWTIPGKKMIGIQVGAVSFVDEGVDPVLDNVQKLGAVNTLFVATFTYGRGIAGTAGPRSAPARPRQAGVRHGFPGGNYTKIHPQYLREHRAQGFPR